LRDLGKRAAILELSNEMIKESEPEILVQVEAIREQVTRYNGARAGGDNAALARIKPMLRGLVDKYMADVNKDKEDGLSPDMALMWKDQVYQIVNEALLFFDGFTADGSAPPAPAVSPQTGRLPGSPQIGHWNRDLHHGGRGEGDSGP
jgi:hypothetical protein